MKRYLRLSPCALLVLVLFVLACEGEVISPTSVRLPSPTSYPRLEKDEARARLIELIETNGGCRFPCWWGIVPGKTSWEEVHALLSPFMDSEVDRTLGPDNGVWYIDSLYNYGQFYIEVETNDDLPLTSVLIEDFSSDGYLSNLNLSYIFQAYGMPDGIYIRSPHYEYGGEPGRGDFEMFTYYPSNGFAVRYYYRSYPLKQTIRVCGLNSPSFAEFYLWAPSSDSDFQEVASRASWYPEKSIRTIEETTGWTTASFYTVFQAGTGSGPCIVAPPFE